MAKVALPLGYSPGRKLRSCPFTESIHIIEVGLDAVVVVPPSDNPSSKLKPKSNVSQHRLRGETNNAATHSTATSGAIKDVADSNNINITAAAAVPPKITAIAITGRSHRHVSPKISNTTASPFPLTNSNGYGLTTVHQHYTPPSTALESMFMEATSCRSSQPGVETQVSVWNHIEGVKHPNGLFPPYQLGVSADEGVLSVYRSYKAEDLNFCDDGNDGTSGNTALGSVMTKMTRGGKRKQRNGAWWSDIMFESWRRHSTPSQTSTTSRSYLGNYRGRGCDDTVTSKLRFVAIPEVNNEDVKAVAEFAFERLGFDKHFDMLVVDRDDRAQGAQGWTLFDAFLGTASIKAINRMATDHAHELGYILPSRIYIKYSKFDYPNLGEILLPNLLVEMRRARNL